MLTLEITVGVGTLYRNGSRLQARGITVLPFQQLDLEAIALCPTVDHAVEHLTPILCLCTACAGVEGDDGGGVIVFAAHQNLNALMLGLGLDGFQLGLDLLQGAFVVFFDGHLAQSDGILQAGNKGVIAIHRVLVLLDGLQDLGGIILVAPEIGSKSLLLQLLGLGGKEFYAQSIAQFLNIGSHAHKLMLGFFQLNDHVIYLTNIDSSNFAH